MLYLEDYVELIEHLPVDVRDRFTDMREMDLQVQNTVDDLNARVKSLFRDCHAKKDKAENADDVFKDIRATYRKALDDADEKVQLAGQIYDIVDRHLRKLDQELSKFKMELEADNGGITEILERRSLELDNHVSNSGHSHLHRKRHAHRDITTPQQPQHQNSSPLLPGTNGPLDKRLKLEASDLIYHNSESAPPSVYSSNLITDTLVDNELVKGASRPPSRNSIADSSQSSLIATQSLIPDQPVEQVPTDANIKRKPPSLKDFNKLPDLKIETTEMESGILRGANESRSYIGVDVVDDDSCSSYQDLSIMSPTTPGIRPSRTKKQTSKAAAWNQERMQAEARRGHARDKEHHTSTSPNGSMVELFGESSNTSADWSCDPNEPRYCVCNQVSYGEMVGCDNMKCTIEWFHYGCVGLNEAPKGKWYCQQCTQSMKRRNKSR